MNIKTLLSYGTLLYTVFATIAAPSAFSQNTQTTTGITSPDQQIAGLDNNLEEGWWSSKPKESKILYTTVAAATVIGLYGLADWDYGSGGLHSANEGWFGSDSKYGGADKMGHFWSTYAFSDALTAFYKSWGYAPAKANNYGALSAWTVQFIMELGDATSETQGFSYEDVVMNTIGALTSVLLDRCPELDRKIDSRFEYVHEVAYNFNDYSNQFYSVVLKLDGFDYIENTFLKYIDFQAGYYSRGYDTDEVEKKRAVYAGIGFNFSRLLNQNGWKKTGRVLEYIQVPYTVPKVSHDLD